MRCCRRGGSVDKKQCSARIESLKCCRGGRGERGSVFGGQARVRPSKKVEEAADKPARVAPASCACQARSMRRGWQSRSTFP
jgi:hypothetical protein